MTRTWRTWITGVALLAFNAQFCPCPAYAAPADEAAGSALHAHHAAQSTVANADCHGDESRDDCGMALGETADASAKPNDRAGESAGILLDRTSVLPSRNVSSRHRTLRPPDAERLANDSPVLRADLLLD